MGRCIDLGRNRDVILPGNGFQRKDILLRIRTISGTESWETIPIEAKCGILMHPIRAISGSYGVIVQMKLEIVHFIPCHEAHVIFQKTMGKYLRPTSSMKPRSAYCG